MATRGGHTDIAQALIDAGADLDIQDDDGYTALKYATQYRHTAIAQFIRQKKLELLNQQP